MRRHRGGQWVKGGSYWNLVDGELVTVSAEGGLLPSDAQAFYIRAPLGALMVLGPLAGLAYIIFLPLIGIVMVANFAARKTWEGMRTLARATISLLTSPQFRPGVSYLTRREQVQKSKTPPTEEAEQPAADKIIAELEREIAARQKKEQD